MTSAAVGTRYEYDISTTDTQGGNRVISAPALPSWLQLNSRGNDNARLEGTPAQAHVGTHAVSLLVRNVSTNATATQSFTITVTSANSPPTFTSTPVTSATQGSAYTYSITTADPNAGNTRTVSAQGNLPNWLTLGSVNPAAGTATLSGTPGAANVGTHSVTLRVTDNAGAFATQAFTITVAVVNSPPTFTSTPTTTVTQSQSYTYNVTTADADAGQTRTITAPLLPSWLTLSGVNPTAGTATLSGTPGAGSVGAHAVTLRVTDNGSPSAFATQSFTITVGARPNDPPTTVGSIPSQTATEETPFELRDSAGAPTTLAAFFRDPDGDDLTYEVTGLPASGRITVNRTTGAIAGTPTASDARDTPYTLEARASDTQSLSPPQRFNLTIALVNRADLSLSVVATPQPATTNAGVEWAFTVANAGPQASGAANLSAEFAGNSFSFSQLGSCSIAPAGDRQTVTCNVPPVAAGATTQIAVRGSAAQAGDVVVAAEIRGAGPNPIDPSDANNRAFTAANIAQSLGGPAQSLGTTDNTGAAAGDVNGDGFVDLVLPKSTGRAAEIYVNVVNPANAAQRRLSESPLTLGDPTPSSDATLADVDNDGDLDLVTTNVTGLSNNVFINDGRGTFTLWATLGSGNSRAVAASDFNGDTFVDLAFANNGANSVYLNSAGARFTPSDAIDDGDNRDVVAADFDLDGRVDLVFANATGPSRFARNLGGGQFADGVTIDNGGTQAVASGDFNGDNRPDLVFARATGGSPSIVFYQNNPGSGSSALFLYRSGVGAALVADVLVADVDLDGLLDVVAISSTGTHQVYRGNGALGFALHPVQFTSGSPDGAVLGKLGVDDRVDLAVAGTRSAGVFFNDGAGGFGAGDTQAPVIQLNGPTTVTLMVEGVYQDAGATAMDAVDGNLTTKIVTGNPVNPSVVGNYTVTYDVTDSSGNAATRQTRTVRVEPREGTGGGGGGAVGTPIALLGLLLYLIIQVPALFERRTCSKERPQ